MAINPSRAKVVNTRGPDWLVTAATIARRFYLEGRSKVDIGDELGVSRFQIARMLDEARQLGLVEVSIALPMAIDADLSDRVQKRLGLRRVIVVGAGDLALPEDQVRRSIGAILAGLLGELVEPQMTLGVACSRTMVQMAEQLEQLAPCTVVQVCGTMAGTDPSMGGGEIVAQLARIADGQAHHVYAPLLVRDEAVAAGLRAEAGIAQTFARYDSLDVAVVPIGGWGPTTTTVFAALTDEERGDAAGRGVVGEMTGRLFDRRGRHPATSFDTRLVAITLDQLRAVPLLIASAYGADRAEAVLAAVRGCLVDVLVTDSPLALRLLELDPP